MRAREIFELDHYGAVQARCLPHRASDNWIYLPNDYIIFLNSIGMYSDVPRKTLKDFKSRETS